MFIWTAINVDENYDYIKSNISCVERKYAYKYSCLSLPLHVSLKISFEISDDKFEYVQNDLTEILREAQTFLLTPKYI